MNPKTKQENMYDQKTLKFYILILAPHDSTGAQPETKCGENEIQNGQIMEIFENLRNHPG
jgi:hypothetical protein